MKLYVTMGIFVFIGLFVLPVQTIASSGFYEKESEKYHEKAIRAREKGRDEMADLFERKSEQSAEEARSEARREARQRQEREDDSEYYEDDNYTAPKKVYTFSRPTPAPQRHRETQWFRAR